jgi:hypothetical protein
MDPDKEYWLRVGLELRLRQSSGDAFQDFFGRLMEARYGQDYVRVRPFGRLGDKGCDGYLRSCGRVYQCYGAVNGEGGKVAYLLAKIKEDFAKARDALRAIMKEWCMVHNLVDGLPIEAVRLLEEIQTSNSIPCGLVGLENMTVILFELDDNKIGALIGPMATLGEERNLQPNELRDLVRAILQAVDERPVPPMAEIKEVSVTKLAYNALPSHWAHFISAGWQNAHHVGEYFARHPDPLTGERVAQFFRDRYAYLRAQNLEPSVIIVTLFEMIVGKGRTSVPQIVAAQALIAHFFESCDILEDAPGVQSVS